MNLDPLRRLKDAIEAGHAVVYLHAKNPSVNQPSDHFHLVTGAEWVRFSLVEGKYPAQRHTYGPLRAPSHLWSRIPFGQIPIPMRHALAGWYWNHTGGVIPPERPAESAAPGD